MKPSRLLAAVCLALTACANGAPGLTRVTESPTSARCANGGVIIATGTDSNTNGTLEDSEVANSVEVCATSGGVGPDGPAGPEGPAGDGGLAGDAGADGVQTLTTTTTLAPGTAPCTGGGVRLDIGPDDGANGGTAGNGVLETGEIASTQYVCNGGIPYFPGSLTAPASPAGAFTIDTRGGSVVGNGPGARGGEITVSVSNGSLGGHAKVFKTGAADAGFALPSGLTFQAGAQPLAVTTDLTIARYNNAALGLASADPVFWVSNDQHLLANVAGAAVEVTSLDVSAGATLTLPHDGSGIDLFFHRDVRNAGTIRTARQIDNRTPGNLRLRMSSYYGLPGSAVRVEGLTVAGQAGAPGGFLELVAQRRVVNEGTLSTRGADGDNGGDGAAVLLQARFGEVFNTGPITTRGGVGASVAGSGGSIELLSGSRGVRNAGALETSGGDGADVGGGAGNISFNANSLGAISNTGTLTARGGACSNTNCSGGGGGQVALRAFGGDLRHHATIDTSGASGQGTGTGGPGGTVIFDAADDTEDDSLPRPSGSVFVSGNITTRGGNGDLAGTGGHVEVSARPTRLPQGQEVTLLGYTSFTASAGNSGGGAGTAGSGGNISVTNSISNWFGLQGAGGGAVLEADVVSRGGDGYEGGSGGTVWVYTQMSQTFMNPNEVARVGAASIDVRSGSTGVGDGRPGGAVFVFGAMGASNTAALNTSGGQSSGGIERGGSGGTVDLLSTFGPVTNSGAVTSNGGSASGVGGAGGAFTLRGATATNTAAIACNGGNGTQTGGGGGRIKLVSLAGTTAATAAQLSVAGGSGLASGAAGVATIDGANVTP